MKIAVVAANGKAGQLITKEAVDRGLDVTAIVRSANKSAASKVIQKDIFALTKEDVHGFDVVIDAFGIFDPEKLDQYSTTLNHLSDILSGTDTRLLIVGGASSLYIDDTRQVQLFATPDFPAAYKPVAGAMKASLVELKKRNDVKWTFISPAAEFIADGARTGEYLLAGDVFTVNDKGESQISYADYAIAMIDEATKGKHFNEQISVLGK